MDSPLLLAYLAVVIIATVALVYSSERALKKLAVNFRKIEPGKNIIRNHRVANSIIESGNPRTNVEKAFQPIREDLTEKTDTFDSPKILVVGVGGGGIHSIDWMINKGLGSVSFCTIDTDLRRIQKSEASTKIFIGKSMHGLGSQDDPDFGRKAAIDHAQLIRKLFLRYDVIILVGGMGGGTASGAIPVLAEVAHSTEALVIGTVSRPLGFEAKGHERVAYEGIQKMRPFLDLLLICPNERAVGIFKSGQTHSGSFISANNFFYNVTQCISALIAGKGLIDVDLADIKTVLLSKGDATFGTGTGTGPSRAKYAAERALESLEIEELKLRDSNAILINVMGGSSMSLLVVSEAMQIIHDLAGDKANIIFGAAINDNMRGQITVSIILVGDLAANAEPIANSTTIVAAEEAFKGAQFIHRLGTLIEKRSESSFVREGTEAEDEVIEALVIKATAEGQAQKLEPVNYDTPAYVRRGILLPDSDELPKEKQNKQTNEDNKAIGSSPAKPPDRDDRPAFLKRIMD